MNCGITEGYFWRIFDQTTFRYSLRNRGLFKYHWLRSKLERFVLIKLSARILYLARSKYPAASVARAPPSRQHGGGEIPVHKLRERVSPQLSSAKTSAGGTRGAQVRLPPVREPAPQKVRRAQAHGGQARGSECITCHHT